MSAKPAPAHSSAARQDIHEELMATLKRRGYLQPSYEIYGGVAGFFDYGPLGAALKTNLENLWRRHYVLGEGMAEIQCPTISPEQVFRASGHLEKFADTVIDCPECGAGNRGDHLVRNEWKRMGDRLLEYLSKNKLGAPHAQEIASRIEAVRESADRDPSPENLRALLTGTHTLFAVAGGPFERGFLFHYDIGDGKRLAARSDQMLVGEPAKPTFHDEIKCPTCQKPLDVTKARIAAFNLMFKTNVGPGAGRVAYLRPETAQGMFMDFGWLYRFFREKLPFGAVQVGKAYRNEISPRQSLLRLREFHQMEAEVFFDPEAKSWPAYERLAGKTLNLLHRDATVAKRGADEPAGSSSAHPEKMRMGDAVEKGIIANGALGYFIALTSEFLEAAGIPADIIRFRQHGREEKAHYSTDTWDAEFESPRFGWVEIVGIADRTDYDLKAHERVSGQKLRAMRRFPEAREAEVNRYVPNPTKLGPAFKGKAGAISQALRDMEAPETAPSTLTVSVDGEDIALAGDMYRVEKRVERVEGEWYVPHVVEPSYGIDRIFYAVLESSWTNPSAVPAGAGKEWTTLKLAPSVAPVKCGVFPLMAKDGMDEIAQALDRDLRHAGLASQYDDGGAIGRRYARQDEIGTPFCVTVDYQTKDDGTVTLRERDSGKQKRVPRARLVEWLPRLVRGDLHFAEIDAPAVA
jgi:glycyl-tRNA synthetase